MRYVLTDKVVDKATKVYFKINRTEQVRLVLYNENGLPLETIFDGTAVKDEQKQYRVNLSKVTGHVGYIKLILPDKILVRKLLLIP